MVRTHPQWLAHAGPDQDRADWRGRAPSFGYFSLTTTGIRDNGSATLSESWWWRLDGYWLLIIVYFSRSYLERNQRGR